MVERRGLPNARRGRINWTLVRFLGFWVVALAVFLGNLYRPAPHSHADSETARWIAASPRRTAGCPGLAVQLAAWQRELWLADWSIELTCGTDPAEEDLLGTSRRFPDQHSAEVAVRDGLSRGWQNYVLVHELTHVAVGAKRLAVPPGESEEHFVERMSERFYLEHRHDVFRAMLGRPRGGGRTDRSAVPPRGSRAALRQGETADQRIVLPDSKPSRKTSGTSSRQ
jgi:hypothetical protein